MPADTSTQGGVIIAIVVILALIGLVALRRWLTRFLVRQLENPAGRTVFGVLLCLGGFIFGFTSSTDPTTGAFQNNWPVGLAIAGAGLLLLIITFGIPLLSKRWEQTATEQKHAAGQPWSSSMPSQTPPFFNQPASPSMPNMPTPQPGGIMPTPQPGGFNPTNMPTPQPYPPR